MDFVEFLDKLKKFEQKQKLKNKIAFLFPGFFFMFTTAQGGILISQFVRNAHNGYSAENATVKLIRRPLGGSIDTVYTNVWYGMWATHGANFEPDLKVNDTLDVFINKEGYTAKCRYVIKSTASTLLPDVHLDNPSKPPHSRTPLIYCVRDTSIINAPLFGIFELKKNPAQPCSALVDTLSGPDRVYDWFLNTEYQDSTVNHGDSARIILKKRVGLVTYLKIINYIVDTTKHFDALHIKSNGNTGSDTIVFPDTFLVGIGENLERKVEKTQLLITPISSNGLIKLNKEVNGFLYDAMGNKVMTFNSDELDLRKLPKGIYFIKPEDEEYKPEKIIYLK